MGIIAAVAQAVEGRVRKSYSGRGMFGKSCMGIECSSVTECIEVAAQHGLTGAKWDSMGKSYIVYWPHVPAMQSVGV